jgi:hypothetical protein
MITAIDTNILLDILVPALERPRLLRKLFPSLDLHDPTETKGPKRDWFMSLLGRGSVWVVWLPVRQLPEAVDIHSELRCDMGNSAPLSRITTLKRFCQSELIPIRSTSIFGEK